MRYYLAGPMSGLPYFNYPQFELAATSLREQGLDISSPHEDIFEPANMTYELCMRLALMKLLRCDAVIMLQGWERSSGAMLEFQIATKLKMKAFTFDTKTCTLEEMSCLKREDISQSSLTRSPGL